MSPPQLSGNTPVADILQPVQISLIIILWHELQFACLDRLNRRLCQFFHGNEPLRLYHRLNRRLTSVMGTDIVDMIFNTNQQSHLVHLLNDDFTCLIAIHAFKFATIAIDGRIII